MPKLSAEQQESRSSRILDAAELCFAKQGFHRTSMQDICRQAGVSAGALYLYFDSKEALIEGISARNRDEVLQSFSHLAEASDFQSGLAMLLQECILDKPEHKSRLWLDIGAEATRNARVHETIQQCDALVLDALAAMLEKAKANGVIDPVLPLDEIVMAMAAMADGLFWRSAVIPGGDTAMIGRTMLTMVSAVLRPVHGATAAKQDINKITRQPETAE